MLDDLRDTFDAVFPRAMIWAFVWTALLALGTLGAAKADFKNQPNPMVCAPIPEFMEKFSSFDLKLIAEGTVLPGVKTTIGQEKSGQWHFVLFDHNQGVGCIIMMGTQFKMLKKPIDVPHVKPVKKPKVMGPNDL